MFDSIKGFVCSAPNLLTSYYLSFLFIQTGATGVICYKYRNDVRVTSFRATERMRPTFNNNGLIAGTKLLYKSYQSGQLFCSFRRRVVTPSGSELYMLDLSQNQHAIWAMGPLAKDNLPGQHPFRASSGQPIDIRFMVCKKHVGFEFKNYSRKLWE